MVLSLRKTMPFDLQVLHLHVSLRTVYNSLIIGQNPIQDSQSMVYLRKKLIQVCLNRLRITIAFKLNLAERFDSNMPQIDGFIGYFLYTTRNLEYMYNYL